MNDRDWAGELSIYLQQHFVRLCEIAGQPRSNSELRINPPLAPEEAKNFMSGMEGGLFRIDETAVVRSERFPHPDFKQELCRIFATSPPPPRLLRENICQMATASSLVLERGWLTGQIRTGTENDVAYGVDMFIESDARELLVCVEIKRSAHELQKFVGDFQQCCRRGEHAKADCAFQQNHDMFEFCAKYQPTYLWIVVPGHDTCFKLNYFGGMVEFEELETLPRRSHVEFGSSSSSPA